jgi:DNA primase
MFPIFDISGRVIAFSGRILVDDPKAPKYLNSPETVLFKKSETLYGLHKAKTEIRKKDYTILVEGQLDLLMCHQTGFSNAVASSGTAFTEAHLMKLQRLSNRLTLAFDSDKAGFTAANKSAVLALSLGMEVKIVDLPSGSDPAELILHDSEAWKDALKSGKHLIDFYLDNLLREKHNERALAKEIEKKVLPYIAMIQSSIEQAHFVAQIVKKTGIRDDAIWNDLRKIPKGIPATPSGVSVPHSDDTIRRRKDHIERHLVGIAFWQEALDKPMFDSIKLRARMVGIAGEQYVSELFRGKKEHSNELVFEAEAYYGSEVNLISGIEELLFNFEKDIIQDKLGEIMKEINQAQASGDEKLNGELLIQFQEITNKREELSKRRIESNN